MLKEQFGARKKARNKAHGRAALLVRSSAQEWRQACPGAILGIDDRPRFREYVVLERRPSYRYNEDLRVGVVLPESGVTYYDMPPEYRAPDYRYTYVNDRAVIVDPRTRRVIDIID